jgi:hypothetical protein
VKAGISFDFDGCLADSEELQAMARTMTASRIRVFILTSRCEAHENRDVLAIAQRCGIRRSRILKVCESDKWRAMVRHMITTHFDDDIVEVDVINENLPGRAVLFNYRRYE